MQPNNRYANLRAEASRKGLTYEEMARRLGVNYATLSRKLSQKTRFTLQEAFKLRDTCFPDRALEYLFEEDRNTG